MNTTPPRGTLELVAILRGVTTSQVVAVGRVLYEAGFRSIEVPLNSPTPFASIGALAALGLPDLRVGAGTVLTVNDVARTREAGGTLVVSPNTHDEVIRHAVALRLDVMPGFATASEAFEAIAAGAKHLKLFPAVTYGPQHLKALGAVLPAGVRVFPVGGVALDSIPDWLAVGAGGFGFGSEVFRPEYSLDEIKVRAARVIEAVRGARVP